LKVLDNQESRRFDAYRYDGLSGMVTQLFVMTTPRPPEQVTGQ
jgi:hypothetical protein